MIASLFGKKTTACPYCYHALDVNRVAFRCSGRGEPGRPACQPVTDPRRALMLNSRDAVMPAIGPIGPDGSRPVDQHGNQIDTIAKASARCQGCGGESGVRICPSCHSLLPRSLDNDSPLFGLVGVPRSGKTVLLSVLHRELVRKIARRFNASIDNPGGASGFARDLDQFEQNMSREGGVLPSKTVDNAGLREPAVYEWKHTRGGKTASTIFSFYDNAGENVSQQERLMQQQYLGQASGIILLLDPFGFPANTGRATERGVEKTNSEFSPESALDGITYLLQTEHNVKRNKKIKVPLAIVVSKIDAFFDQVPSNHPLRQRGDAGSTFDEAESQSIHDHMAALIHEWEGDNLLRKLDENYENYRLFGVSALGAEPDYASGAVNSRGVLPHRVADPLLWLLADSGFVPKTKV